MDHIKTFSTTIYSTTTQPNFIAQYNYGKNIFHILVKMKETQVVNKCFMHIYLFSWGSVQIIWQF